MKRFCIVCALIIQSLIAGTAFAMPVNIDFSVLGINSVDITSSSNPAGYTLNGVTFRYDDFGSGADFASVDAAGIFGTTGGSLIFDFATPVRQLQFNYSLLGLPAPVPGALILTLYDAGADQGTIAQDALANDVNGDAAAQFLYNGEQFDRAQMFYNFDAPFFSVAALSYDTEPVPVPEPSLFLTLAGIAGLACFRFFPRRS